MIIDDIDPAYLPHLLLRLGPFERWIVEQRYGPDRLVRSAADIGDDCGLSAQDVTAIAERAVGRMRAIQSQSGTD